MDYMITNLDIINYLIIAVGIGVSILGITVVINSSMTGKSKRIFALFLAFLIIYTGSYLIRMLIVGHPGSGIRTALNAVVFCEYYVTAFMPAMIILLIIESVFVEHDMRGNVRYFMTGILVLHSILTIAAHFTHLYYYFDDGNVYHRAKYYLISNVGVAFILLQGMVILVRYRDKFKGKVYRALWMYMVAPLVGMVLQTFNSEIKWIIFATVMASAYMFVVITADFNQQLLSQRMEKTRIESELSLATRIQESMLPALFPAFPERSEFDLYASMTPAKEVGGDFYDFFMVDDDHLALVMADVSGKGIPGAMFMMVSKNVIANHVMLGKSPAKALEDANNAICANNSEEMFVTVWLGILQISTGVLVCANAGHEYPALRQKGGAFELLKDKHGFSVGFFEDSDYEEYEIVLEPGDKIFLYTDGVPEATAADQKMFGTDRMIETLNKDVEATPKEMLENMWTSVQGFVAGAEQFDDLTMLALEYKG